MWNKRKKEQIICQTSTEGDCSVVGQIRELSKQLAKTREDIKLINNDDCYPDLGRVFQFMTYHGYRKPSKTEISCSIRWFRQALRAVAMDNSDKDVILKQFSSLIETEKETLEKEKDRIRMSNQIQTLKESLGIE